MKIRERMAGIESTGLAHAPLAIDPTEYADPLFGVGSATSAGPTLPSGSIHPSPETLEKDCGGYLRNQPIIGFGQAFISGAGGVKCYGNYLIAPTLDTIELDHAKRASYAVGGKERARSYEYSVTLENGISVKTSPAHHSAIYSIDYPAGHEALLLLDVAHKLDLDACMRSGNVFIDPKNRTVSGGGIYFGNWNRADWEMYFTMKFDSDFTDIGVCRGKEKISCMDENGTSVSVIPEDRFVTYVSFGNLSENLSVRVKISISLKSVENARKFLDDEIPDFDYDDVRERARDAWRKMLGTIELSTDDSKLLRRFYTAMYHMNIQPRDRTRDHGYWDDFHTVWDTWKTVFPMYSMLYPEKMAAIIESFIDRARINREKKNGVVIADEFSTAHEFLAGQGGNDVDNAIVDAYLRGVKLDRYDWEDAYEVLLWSAEQMRSKEYVERGFATNNRTTVSGLPYTIRFKSAAATMGFAFNDKAISNMAREIGSDEEYRKYDKRSANWLNVWNKDAVSEGFVGFPQSPLEDGSFEVGFDPHRGYNSHFYEATAWDAQYINYNDVPRMVEAMGGKDLFIKRLLWACEHSVNYYNDDEGAEGYLNFTNEPSFHIPWLFCTDEIRRPDLASRVIDDIIKRFSLENDYPGDEDNGGMSSYYVFLMCGFFPYSTTDKCYLHGTRLEKITFRLGNGNVFTVSGENVSDKNIYIQSATWRGEPLNACSLDFKEILEGGELKFVMGDTPSDFAKA